MSKIFVTGATGYIGGAVAGALLARGHHVQGLARSARSAGLLHDKDVEPVIGDFTDTRSLTRAIAHADPDVVISTASVGSLGGTAATFARDRDAVTAMRNALGDSGKTLIFTSGSAVFGVFNDGYATTEVYNEMTSMPLPATVIAPPQAQVHPIIASGLAAAMRARVQTEHLVTTAEGVRGIVVRPGLVYGHGGSFDLPALIKLSRAHGHGVHLGPGATVQSYVHINDLAELYCLAVEHAPHGAILHGVTGDISQHDLACAISQMLGVGHITEGLVLEDMLGLDSASRFGLRLTRKLPLGLAQRMQGIFPQPDSVGTGISLSLNKRLSSEFTRHVVGWNPMRTDILSDIAFGSYVR